MKYGTIWFLHLDTLIQFSRIAVILSFIAGAVTMIGSILFILSWILFAIFLVITIATCFMHIPSSKKVEKFIADYEAEFIQKVKAEFRNYQSMKLTTLRCYSNDSKMNLSRWIGSKKIYGTLTMLAWVEAKNEIWLIRDEQSLTRDQEHVTTRHKLNTFRDVTLSKEPADPDGEVNWSLQIDDQTLHFCCKDDYHLRDFLERCKA